MNAMVVVNYDGNGITFEQDGHETTLAWEDLDVLAAHRPAADTAADEPAE